MPGGQTPTRQVRERGRWAVTGGAPTRGEPMTQAEDIALWLWEDELRRRYTRIKARRAARKHSVTC
jgi:hypothetical protein